MVIAFSGASSGIGRFILDELLSQKKHKVILLSRSEQPDIAKQGADVRIVDYTSADSLYNALKGVDTLISTQTYSVDYVQTHKNLIEASEKAGVKRLIPSEFAQDVEHFPDASVVFQFKTDTRKLIEKCNLEYTYVSCGFYMDYFKPTGQKIYFRETPMPVNIEAGTGLIPGTGEEPITFTLATDIAKAVAVLLDEPKWEKYTFINGHTTTLNNIVKAGEASTGKKFDIKYLSKEEIMKNVATATDFMEKLKADTFLAIIEGNMALKRKRDFSGVKFTTVEELCDQYYKQ